MLVMAVVWFRTSKTDPRLDPTLPTTQPKAVRLVSRRAIELVVGLNAKPWKAAPDVTVQVQYESSFAAGSYLLRCSNL